jgi:hypothetical protein
VARRARREEGEGGGGEGGGGIGGGGGGGEGGGGIGGGGGEEEEKEGEAEEFSVGKIARFHFFRRNNMPSGHAPTRTFKIQPLLRFGCRHVDGYTRRIGDISQQTLPNFG